MTQAAVMGCIADDFTGATDLAGLLQRSGMRVVQCFGVPGDPNGLTGLDGGSVDSDDADLFGQFDAIVIALKTRSIPSDQACEQTCQAAEWLRQRGVTRFFFKYCSTFDSTIEGNIGPVTQALMKQLGVEQTIFCPAFPENCRTVYMGHLFVGPALLNESGMENHPLNPMTDANLVRFLTAQTRCHVDLLSHSQLHSDEPIRNALNRMGPLVIVDAICDDDLELVAQAVANDRLVTGGSAIAGCIANELRRQGIVQTDRPPQEPFLDGPAAVLSGSCSLATQAQIRNFRQHGPVYQIDVLKASQHDPLDVVQNAKVWIANHLDQGPVLISTTTDADTLRKTQQAIGSRRAAELAEYLLSEIGEYLVQQGVVRLVIAGGETSGAVTQRLGVRAVRIGREIAPGVPWTESIGQRRIALALKSGNFGGPDFFRRAIECAG